MAPGMPVQQLLEQRRHGPRRLALDDDVPMIGHQAPGQHTNFVTTGEPEELIQVQEKAIVLLVDEDDLSPASPVDAVKSAGSKL